MLNTSLSRTIEIRKIEYNLTHVTISPHIDMLSRCGGGIFFFSSHCGLCSTDVKTSIAKMFKLILLFLITFGIKLIFGSLPLVINTWNFQNSTVKGKKL